MSSSETGHAKNAANARTLIVYLANYAGKYLPVNPLIKLPALQTLSQDIDAALADLSKKRTIYGIETGKCTAAFKPLNTTSTAVTKVFRTSGAPDHIIDKAETLNKKIQPSQYKTRKKSDDPPKEGEEPTSKTISTSQQSRDQKINHFDELILLAEETPEYQPAETDVQTATLRTYLADLKAANEGIKPVELSYSDALDKRDELMYHPKTGLIERTRLIKNYIEQVYKVGSPQAKQCRALEFKDLNRK